MVGHPPGAQAAWQRRGHPRCRPATRRGEQQAALHALQAVSCQYVLDGPQLLRRQAMYRRRVHRLAPPPAVLHLRLCRRQLLHSQQHLPHGVVQGLRPAPVVRLPRCVTACLQHGAQGALVGAVGAARAQPAAPLPTRRCARHRRRGTQRALPFPRPDFDLPRLVVALRRLLHLRLRLVRQAPLWERGGLLSVPHSTQRATHNQPSCHPCRRALLRLNRHERHTPQPRARPRGSFCCCPSGTSANWSGAGIKAAMSSSSSSSANDIAAPLLNAAR